MLRENKIKASFYPPVISATHNNILDPTKIHYILSVVDDKKFIFDHIKNSYLEFYETKDEESFNNIVDRIDTTDRFDSKIIIAIKILLQKALPYLIRTKICDTLFKKFVSDDILSFSKEIYMSTSNIKELLL